MDEPHLYVITGIMAAGKSTVGQALAQRFERGVHLRGDQFRRAIVSGRREMAPDPEPEALTQLRLRYRLAATVAEHYLEAGFTTVWQDVILGSFLSEVVAMVEHLPVQVVVLAPQADEVARRERGRAKTGYTSYTPEQLNAGFRRDTPRIGLWLDTTSLTIEQTVDEILRSA